MPDLTLRAEAVIQGQVLGWMDPVGYAKVTVLNAKTGKAMTEGGMGETVTIQNPASFRQISGVVIGPGQVRAQQGGNRLATLHP